MPARDRDFGTELAGIVEPMFQLTPRYLRLDRHRRFGECERLPACQYELTHASIPLLNVTW